MVTLRRDCQLARSRTSGPRPACRPHSSKNTAQQITRRSQSIVQTQKSREFPGCRIIHTFYATITPPGSFAARRVDRLRLGLLQVAEEIAAWVQHHHVAFVREAFTVSAQATVERVELLILT